MLEANDILELQPAEKPYKRFGELGLYLLVSPCGGKWWRFRYRFDRRHKTLSCGIFPDTSIDQARAQRDEFRALIAQGIDPSAIRREEKARNRATQLELRAPPTVRVAAVIDGTVEVWKGRAVVRLTANEARMARDLLTKLIV
jgi:hypothetical protein